MQELKNKYNVSESHPIDQTQMQPEDLRALQGVQLAMQVPIRNGNFAEDIQNILDWWRVANIVYESRKQDIYTYGADPNYIGKTIEEQQKTFGRRKQVLLFFWYKANEKVPSTQASMLGAMSKPIDTIPKQLLNPDAEPAENPKQ